MKTRVRAVNILFAVALLALAGFAIGAPNAERRSCQVAD